MFIPNVELWDLNDESVCYYNWFYGTYCCRGIKIEVIDIETTVLPICSTYKFQMWTVSDAATQHNKVKRPFTVKGLIIFPVDSMSAIRLHAMIYLS